jgi:hypothetical protein
MVCCILVLFQIDLLAFDCDEFAALSQSEQHSLIAKNFATWLDATRNMHYTSTRTLTLVKKNNKEHQQMPKYIHQHWLKDDLYRITTEVLDPTGNRGVVQDYQSAFDKRRGEMRATIKNPLPDGSVRLNARIDTVQDPTIMHNPFVSWLSDKFVASETQRVRFDDFYLFPLVLKQRSKWEIVLLPEKQQIKLIVPFELEFPFQRGTRQVGQKTLFLDPQKGFLPVLIDAYWEELPKPPGTMFQTVRYTVEESEKFGSVWVPTTLQYEILASSSIPDQINVYTMQITNVEFGTVIDSDVAIIFPEGTEVVDAIKGITYKTDARGNPIESTMEYLYDFDPSGGNMPLPENKPENNNYVLLAVGIVMILVAIYMMFQKRRNASRLH